MEQLLQRMCVHSQYLHRLAETKHNALETKKEIVETGERTCPSSHHHAASVHAQSSIHTTVG